MQTCSLRGGQGSDDQAGQLMAGDEARNGVPLPRFQQKRRPFHLVGDTCTTASDVLGKYHQSAASQPQQAEPLATMTNAR